MSNPIHSFTATSSHDFDCAFCDGRVNFICDDQSGALAIVHNLPPCKAYDDLDPDNADHFVAFARAIRRREDAKIMKLAGIACAPDCVNCADEECVTCGTVKADHVENCDGCNVLTRHGLGMS